MKEWLLANWEKLLGTGGLGIIIVSLINLISKGKPSISQKSKSGNNSTTYQAGTSIDIKNDSERREGNINE